RHDGTCLRLRPGFAFWKRDEPVEGANQGDVLATVAAVLQHLRTHPGAGGGEPKLHHTAFHGALLAPATFGRYNDGVIQAAFLRAALPRELDYGSVPEQSNAMARVVERTLECWNSGQGEACGEFLLALA